MSTWMRYDSWMRRGLPILLAVVGMMAVPAMEAQINGTRASVTSVGGSPIFPPGPRASVTSLGPQGYTPRFHSPNCCASFHLKNPHSAGYGGRFGYGVGVLPLYSMPYYYGYGYGDVIDPVDDSMEQGYGPASDRQRPEQARQAEQQQYYDERLSRIEQQMDQMDSSPKTQAADNDDAKQASVADQPDTVLVFRDGHSLDVKNYAIVGDAVYDLSGGARHKIALADLDLDATEKLNEARGLDFRLPTRPIGN